MAEVWLARHRGAGGIQKRVVVKRILRERSSDPRFLDLFVSEAQISMALTHKNVVPTFDFGRVGDEFFLVMEYIEGTNLALAMRAAKQKDLRPSPQLLCHIAFEACQALEYAHGFTDSDGVAREIVHRDVTPANLFLSAAGEVKLGDFGLAQETNTEAEGSARGTPRYMAPEQATGGVVGPACDIFALGLLLRDCLVFDVLRKGTQEEQLEAAKKPVPPLPETISEEMRAICEKATQFSPDARYASAKAMSEDLDRALLHARMEEADDRRPMPERLADWVASLELAGPTAPGAKAETPEGHTVTFLDDGIAEVIAGPGDATMRSMAATGIEPAETDAPSSGGDTPEESSEESPARVEHSARRLWIAIGALLVVPASVAAYLALGPSHSNKAPDFDATRAPASDVEPTDASVPEASAPVDAAPAPTIVVDASFAKPDARRKSNPDKNPTPQPAGALGKLRISSAPWATVEVVGRSEACTETPCQLELPAGTYQLQLRNPVAGLRKNVRATIREGEISKIHEVLEAPLR